MRYRHLLLLAALGLAAPRGLRAQRLTLAQALARAEASGYANRAARAHATAEGARALEPLRGILPTLRVEGGWLRTTEPVGAFGVLLNQRELSLNDFDPAVLNHPPARNNWSGGVVAEVPLLNADAWAGRSAARAGGRAAAAEAEWTAGTTRLQVVSAYYAAQMAADGVATLEAAQVTAAAAVRQAGALLTQGVVTRSDLLLAQVRAGEIETALLRARADLLLARRQLALLLGTPGDTTFTLPDSLPSSRALRAVADSLALLPSRVRADVDAAKSAALAADRDAFRAKGRLIPRLNAVGRYTWNDPTTPFAGDPSWTVGVMASWSLFSGATEIGDLRGTRARAAAAQAMAEAAEGAAAVERAARESDVTVALARLSIAEQGVVQGSEASRLLARQYAGGLTGITELLGAQAAETETQLRLTQARVALITALAARALARGADPAAVVAVEEY